MNLDEATVAAITGGLSGGPPPGPDTQSGQGGLDPAVLAALQGGAGRSPVNQRMYDAPAPQQDSYALPPAIAQAVQSGFAPVPPGVVDGLGAPGAPQMPPPPGSLHSSVAAAVHSGFAPPPIPGVVDGLGMPSHEPPPLPAGFIPQPLVNPFPEPSAADKKAQAAAAKAQAADAKKQAAYAATPQGEDDAALKASLGINQDQQAIVAQQGELEARAAAADSAVREKALVDSAALQAKVDAARAENLAQQKQMIAERGKDIEAAAKRVPDPNRFYNSLSTMQHIGVGLMTLLSGAGMGLARDNGPNPVVKMMTDAQDRDIDAQKAGIEQGNKAIDAKKQLQQDYGHLGDDENAMWQYRKAQSRVMLADQIEATAAQYKAPKALLVAKMTADGLRMEAAKMVGEQAARRQTQLNTDAGLANTRAQIGIAGGHLALARQEFEEKKQEYKDTRQDKKDAQQEAEDAKIEQIKAAAAAKAAAKGKAPEGGLLGASGDPLLMKNGEPYAGIPKDMYKDIYGKEGSFKSGLDAIDKLRQMRVDDGGHINSHSTGARAAAQQMARLSLAVHKNSGVRLTPEAMELANKVVSGSADPDTVDSYIKTVEPQLDQFREDWQLDHALSLPNFNGDIKQLMYPDPVKNKPAESGNSKFMRQMEERTGGSTLGDQAARDDAVERAAKTFVPPPSTGNVLADQEALNKAFAEHLATVNASSDLHPGQMNDRQAEFLKMAVKALNSGDPVAKAATMKALEQMTRPDSAVPSDLRERAEEMLYKARGYGKVTQDPDEQ